MLEFLFVVLKGIKYVMRTKVSFSCIEILVQHWRILCILGSILRGSSRLSCFFLSPLHLLQHTTLNRIPINAPRRVFGAWNLKKTRDSRATCVPWTHRNRQDACQVSAGLDLKRNSCCTWGNQEILFSLPSKVEAVLKLALPC